MIARRAAIRRTARPRVRRAGAGAATRRKLGDLWSRIVRARAGACERCGRFRGLGIGALDACHVFAKSVYPGARFNLLNGVGLCRACHDTLGSAHITKPSLMQDWYVGKFGPELFHTLAVLVRTSKVVATKGQVEMFRSKALVLGVWV